MNEPRIQDGIYDTAYIPGGPFNGYQVVQNWGSFRRSSMGQEAVPRSAASFSISTLSHPRTSRPVIRGKVGEWESRSNATTPSFITREQATVDIRWDLSDRMSLSFLTAMTEQDQKINVDWENSDYTLVEDILRTS